MSSPVAADTYQRAEASYDAAHPHRLHPTQRALARILATSAWLVEIGEGLAGTGRATVLQVVVAAVRASGGRVMGLSPSALTAAELSADLDDAPAYELDPWLRARRQAGDDQAVPPECRLRAGDVLIIDYISVAGPDRLAAVINEAETAGALVRLLDGPLQLAGLRHQGG
jgi:hypothetical protein